MSNDTELLRRYVEERSESAFTELVREHLNLVYSAALRETSGDGAQAEDLSQAVFTELARKGPRLLLHPSLAGWLYTTVRHMAANLRRAEQRRRSREEEVMNEVLAEGSPNEAWQQIRPVLDDALHELKEADRAVVVLRFLEDRPLREVGERLGLTENAARMRVDRALEKLRGLLARRGITSTASGLAAALAIGAATQAPAALAPAVVTTALAAGGAAAGSTTLTLLKLMSLTNVKTALVGALVVAGVAVPVWQQTRLERARSEVAQLRARETDPAASGGEGERLRAADPSAQSETNGDGDRAELERLRQYQAQTQPELLRLRGLAGLARRSNAEAEELRKQLAQQAAAGSDTQGTGPMGDLMNHIMEQQVESKVSRMTATLHLTPEQAQAAREALLRQARAMSVGAQQAMTGKFNKEELDKSARTAGNPDLEIQALLTPDQKTAWQTYQREESAHMAGVAANTELNGMLSTLNLAPDQLDRVYAALYEINFNQLTGAAKPPATTSASVAEVMQWQADQKVKALESVLTPAQMESYRQEQALQSKLRKDIFNKMQGKEGAK